MRDTITVEGDMSGVIRIGNDLLSTGSIEVDGDLSGQIVINAHDDSEEWLGSVEVGTTPIVLDDGSSQPDEAPFYDRLAYSLGGGAVGLVPYDLHYAESGGTRPSPAHDLCDPSIYDEYYGLGGELTELAAIVLRHYGPIEIDGTGMPVTIYERQLPIPWGGWQEPDCGWSDVTDRFEASASGRELTITKKYGETGFVYSKDYRFDHVGAASVHLNCLETLVGTAPSVADYTYIVRVRYEYDLNENSMVESGDAIAWLANPADFDNDNDADLDDLAMLTDAIANGG